MTLTPTGKRVALGQRYHTLDCICFHHIPARRECECGLYARITRIEAEAREQERALADELAEAAVEVLDHPNDPYSESLLQAALAKWEASREHVHEWHYYDGNETEGTESICACGAIQDDAALAKWEASK